MFKKICLVAGLLLFSVLGLAQLPEIGGRFWPEHFWQTQLDLARKEYNQAELTRQHALESLQALNNPPQQGFSPGTGGDPSPPGGREAARQRLLVTIQRSLDDQAELAEMIQRLEKIRTTK